MGNFVVVEIWTKEDILYALKGNNSCKAYNLTIKVRNEQMVYLRNKSWKPECAWVLTWIGG